jgi:hypothetical protein
MFDFIIYPKHPECMCAGKSQKMNGQKVYERARVLKCTGFSCMPTAGNIGIHHFDSELSIFGSGADPSD